MSAGECERGVIEEIRWRARNLAENTFGIAKLMEGLGKSFWEKARRLEKWSEREVKLYGIYYAAMEIKADLNHVSEMGEHVMNIAKELEERLYNIISEGCGEGGKDN